MWNTVAHHKTILQLSQFWYWNCDNCEIFKIIAVSDEKNSDICDYSVFKYDRWWINLWSVELMAKGSSAVVERLVIKYIVWLKTLILVVNRVMVGKKQEDFDRSKYRICHTFSMKNCDNCVIHTIIAMLSWNIATFLTARLFKCNWIDLWSMAVLRFFWMWTANHIAGLN